MFPQDEVQAPPADPLISAQFVSCLPLSSLLSMEPCSSYTQGHWSDLCFFILLHLGLFNFLFLLKCLFIT